MPFIILGVIIAIIGLYVISIYNFFNATETRINASIQEIGNQLKRQAGLIPNLIESTKGYMQHEKGIFDQLSAARQTFMAASKDPGMINKAAEVVNKLMPQLVAIVESNPQLKADGVVNKLMDELRDTADKIMYSRRTLIDLTADYNMRLVTFPSNIIAQTFNFKSKPGLTTPDTGSFTSVSEADTKDVQVKL